MVPSGCLGTQATYITPSASSLQLSSVLGISWAVGFCLFSSFHVHVEFLFECVFLLHSYPLARSPIGHHRLLGSLTLLFALNLTLIVFWWWCLLLLLEESRWSVSTHSCLFHSVSYPAQLLFITSFTSSLLHFSEPFPILTYSFCHQRTRTAPRIQVSGKPWILRTSGCFLICSLIFF